MRTCFMKAAMAAALALGLATYTAPADAKIYVVASPYGVPAPGSTYAFAPVVGVVAGAPAPTVVNEITAQRLNVAIQKNLAAIGYREVASPDAADYLVSYSVILEPGQELHVFGSGGGPFGFYGSGWGPGSISASTENFTTGTLVLDISQRSTGSLVWRAASDKRIGSKDVDQDRLDRLVQNMTKSLAQKK
jgi:hypothetical protein